MSPVVTLLTDFGTADGYVAAMKGVLLRHAPEARLVDAGQGVPQGAVRRAAWALSRYWDRFPGGTVHVVVVDPGVGTGRRALALEADGRFVVAPDNGVSSRVLEAADAWRAVSVDRDGLPAVPGTGGAGSSATFHGRDVFAPAAALLARGEGLDGLGPPLDDPVRIPEPPPRSTPEGILGQVVTVDGFGNLVTNVPASRVTAGAAVRIAGRTVSLRRTYGDAEPGRVLALINSSQRLEVAVRDGSAARVLDVGEGEGVLVVEGG